SAGRCWRVSRSVYGKGTRTTSPGSKVRIRVPVRLAVPFGEGSERIVRARRVRPRQHHLVSFDPVHDLVSRIQTKRGSNGLGDGGLSLRRELALDHGRISTW